MSQSAAQPEGATKKAKPKAQNQKPRAAIKMTKSKHKMVRILPCATVEQSNSRTVEQSKGAGQ